MGNQQSGAGGGGKDKGEQKEKKKYEPPVPTRSVALLYIRTIHNYYNIYLVQCWQEEEEGEGS